MNLTSEMELEKKECNREKEAKANSFPRFGKLHFKVPFIKRSLGKSFSTVTRSENRPQTKPNNDRAVRRKSGVYALQRYNGFTLPTLLRIKKEKGRSYYYYHDNHICR